MIEYYEPFIELEMPRPQIDSDSLHWVKYNPRKDIARWGASLTSLDGSIEGTPDLDSLFEFNKENGTRHREADFRTPTAQFKSFEFMTEHFDLGRSHILRLGSGGFFPPHRDFDRTCFRLIYTIRGCTENNFIWILNNQVIKLKDNSWYYVNTKMIHSVFSFFGSEFAVFNILHNEKSVNSLIRHMAVK